MTTHAVVLVEPNADVEKRIGDSYPKSACFKLTDTFCLLQERSSSEDVAIAIGLKGEGRIEQSLGVVFELNRFYAGYAPDSLWNWLGDTQGNLDDRSD